MQCPGCQGAMEEQKLEAKYGGELVIDACHACHGFWFDGRESLQLSPGSVLKLFRLIYEHQADSPVPLQEAPRCPRCAEALVLTHDMMKSVRFTYLRCPRGCGRHTTFFQFLREKNLIRDVDPKQLALLKEQVKVIRCSNCGAPIELQKSMICAHCQAPLSALDPKEVQATLAQLQTAELKRQNVDPTLAARLVMDQLSVTSFYRKVNAEHQGAALGRLGNPGLGLVELGLGSLFEWLA